MRFVKDYMRDDILRNELNELTEEIFGFNFESWVTNGYFEGDYIPYSYEENGKMLANVSVNLMKFMQNGQEKDYIQIGTVMTKKDCRNKGYARELMEMVLADYKENCDGLYLFGNLSTLGFYDKLGFSRGRQYRYILKETVKKVVDETHFKLADTQHKSNYINALRHSAVNAALDQINKYALHMFYTAEMEDVYYNEKLDCFVVIEEQENTLYLKSVICTKKISLGQILAHIKGEYKNTILGFTPCTEDAELLEAQLYDGEEEYRFFYIGEELESIENEKLFFPELSHA